MRSRNRRPKINIYPLPGGQRQTSEDILWSQMVRGKHDRINNHRDMVLIRNNDHCDPFVVEYCSRFLRINPKDYYSKEALMADVRVRLLKNIYGKQEVHHEEPVDVPRESLRFSGSYLLDGFRGRATFVASKNIDVWVDVPDDIRDAGRDEIVTHIMDALGSFDEGCVDIEDNGQWENLSHVNLQDLSHTFRTIAHPDDWSASEEELDDNVYSQICSWLDEVMPEQQTEEN